MSSQRYAPEFKDEAVRQVTEKGHSVPEVAVRASIRAVCSTVEGVRWVIPPPKFEFNLGFIHKHFST